MNRLSHLLRQTIRFSTSHRGLHPFWGLAVLGLIAPWMTSCESPTLTSLLHGQRHCTVASIHDGDTMRLICAGEHLQVRLYCIDAPELEQRPWGRESRDHLRAITPTRVILTPHDQDRYGRTVGEVITDDADRENLNLAQVHSGNAAVYRHYCEGNVYYQAERVAKRIGAGIWARPGEQQRPWEYRKG